MKKKIKLRTTDYLYILLIVLSLITSGLDVYLSVSYMISNRIGMAIFYMIISFVWIGIGVLHFFNLKNSLKLKKMEKYYNSKFEDD